MGLLFKILGGIGLICFIVVVPNLHDREGFRKEFLPMAVSILILGIGLVLERLDRLLVAVKTGDSKPTA
jgi:hypothetical protein